MSNPDAAVTYRHDPLGRALSETVNGHTTTYGYDALGRRTSRTTPSGHVSTWTYGAGNSPKTLSTSTGHRLDFGYDPAGNEITRTVDDNAFFLQTFDAAGHLSTQTLHAHDLDTDPLQHRSYTYRADGYLTEITESGTATGTRRFDLTSSGRVTAVHAADWSESYAYDATGNIASATTPATEDSDGPRETAGTLLHRADRTRRLLATSALTLLAWNRPSTTMLTSPIRSCGSTPWASSAKIHCPRRTASRSMQTRGSAMVRWTITSRTSPKTIWQITSPMSWKGTLTGSRRATA
ncbi:hypothetical protein OKJ99_19255 [Streptomyces endophyticus]|uniref:RHS repeat protein n=1 Tax=Streptomyces endophyticus TaxID=714166 RepID=A0ABU6F8E7_9ACTN|nr:hypothetical protein [Streptomyces endophyticus]MEB8339630.1 hypothetical protein [Streptomyces endophyticus]